ncbi:MAG: transglutaminase-like domain-containing protein [Clostridia bacterium]|nr:transglutaminase-like domain-containing protein [Clostridia bacterium]
MKKQETGGGMHPAVITVCTLLVVAAVVLSAWIVLPGFFDREEGGERQGGGWLSKWSSSREPRLKKGEAGEAGTGAETGEGPGYLAPGEDSDILEPFADLDTPLGGVIGGSAPDYPVFALFSTANDDVYLQVKSFGDYTGTGWLDAVPYEQTFGDDLSARRLAASSLPHDQETDKRVTLRMLGKEFAVPYYTFTSNKPCTIADTGVNAGPDSEYTFTYGSVTKETEWEVSPEAAAYEAEYRDFVYEHYLAVDLETHLFLVDCMARYDLVPGDSLTIEGKYDLVNRAAAFIAHSAQYDLFYDRSLDSEGNIAVAFLGQYKHGICSHFATAATLLFRTMGIPARYTVGYVAKTEAGEWVSVTTETAHAWVEVYLDDIGWICVEVTGSDEPAESDELPEEGRFGNEPGIMDGDSEAGSSDEEGGYSGRSGMGSLSSSILNKEGTIGHSSDNEQETDDDLPPDLVFLLHGFRTEFVYLQVKSFGDYTGQKWLDAVEYTKTISDGKSARMLAGESMKLAGADEDLLTIQMLQEDLGVPYYTTNVAQPCRVDDLNVMPGEDTTYEVTYCHPDTDMLIAGIGTLSSYEKSYRSFVYSQYLNLDNETYEYMRKIINDHNFLLPPHASTAEKLVLIEQVARYVRAAGDYNVEYDPSLDRESNIAVAFLDTYHSGICSHFATAGTALFRAIGIPARYTIGFRTDVKADKWTPVSMLSAHAWVEVYLDGIGWICVEVTAAFNGSGSAAGSDEPPPANPYEYEQYIVTPVTTRCRFDGSVVYPEQKVKGLEKLEDKGYTYQVVINGYAREPGYTEVRIDSLRIYDELGKDVTNTLTIGIRSGYIHLYYDEILCVSDGSSGVYNGQPIVTSRDDCRVESGELMSGHSVILDPTGKVDSVGTGPASFDIHIVDQNGVDRTSCYWPVRRFGTLTMEPAELTLKAADAQRPFDGTPLTAPGYEIISGALVPGDVIEVCEVVGSQTQIGRCDNIINIGTLRIVNQDGTDVTANYHIVTEKGTLKVTY